MASNTVKRFKQGAEMLQTDYATRYGEMWIRIGGIAYAAKASPSKMYANDRICDDKAVRMKWRQ